MTEFFVCPCCGRRFWVLDGPTAADPGPLYVVMPETERTAADPG